MKSEGAKCVSVCASIILCCAFADLTVAVVATKRSSLRSTFLRVHTSLTWWSTQCRRSAVETCGWQLLCLKERTSMSGLLSTVSLSALPVTL